MEEIKLLDRGSRLSRLKEVEEEMFWTMSEEGRNVCGFSRNS